MASEDLVIGGGLPPNAVETPRFDVILGGMRLLLPAAISCEYFAQAVVYPVPRAPLRLFGMIHLRGQAIPVLDVQAAATDLLPIVQRCRLVVLREGSAAVGFLCDRPPQPVVPGMSRDDVALPETRFAQALITAVQVSNEEGEGMAWTFEPAELIDVAVGNLSFEQA